MSLSHTPPSGLETSLLEDICRPAMSMKETSDRFMQTTSRGTASATSSPESAGGATHCVLQGGPMTDLFGQEVAPANLSARRAKEPSNKMSATYGRIGIGSSESAALQQSLESRLMTRLPLAGWMTSSMTWKRKRTPALRRYCQLAVSARLIKETDFGLLPTIPAQQQQGGIRMGGGQRCLPEMEKASADGNEKGRKNGQMDARLREAEIAVDRCSLVEAWPRWNGGFSGFGRLDDGVSSRVAKSTMAGFGNAIVPQVAAEFIKAAMT